MNHLQLADILNLPTQLTRGIIAIDGPSGAGKTELAQELCQAYQRRHYSVTVIRTDWFATWDNPVGWWDTMIATVFQPLQRGEAVWFNAMQWIDGKPQPTMRRYVERSRVTIIEGVSSARKSMAPSLDYAIWVDGGSYEQCLERAIARDGEECREHLTRWKDFERGWFAVDKTRQRCHTYTAGF